MTWADSFIQFLIPVVVGSAGLAFALYHLFRLFRR